MRPGAFIAGVAVGLALLAALAVAEAPSPWRLGEVTAERTWWWGEVIEKPVIEGDGYTICAPLSATLKRCVVVSQGIYRRIVVDGVEWEDRRQRIVLPVVHVGRQYLKWLPQISGGAR